MRSTFLVVLMLSAGVALQAADLKLPVLRANDEIYTNVTVFKVTATDVSFSHARGMGNAKLKDLDPQTQKLLGYDVLKAEESQKKQIAANAQYQQSQKVASKKPQQNAVAGAGKAPKTSDDRPIINVSKLHARSVINQPAPKFVVEDWVTQQPDTAGKFVLIDFWATWCPPCRDSIPDLNALHAKFGRDIVFIGVSSETVEEVAAMTAPRINYFQAVDTKSRMSKELQIKGIPHAILIDPQGIVRFEGMPHYLTEAGLEQIIAKYGN